MTTTDQASESVMSRIMKLLALAADESASPHERQLAEERAEKLMAQHMIDRFEAAQRLKHGDAQARKPILSEWDIMMEEVTAQGTPTSYEFNTQIISMMEAVMEHCGVRVNRNYSYISGGRRYKLVGFPEDLMYAERIWFNIFKTFVSNVNPVWDLEASLEENAYTFASAGVSWKNMVLIAEAQGDTRLEWPWRYQDTDPIADFYTRYEWNAGKAIDPGNKPWGQSIHKLKRACKKYCLDNNVPYPYAPGSKLRVATRNSFARSYKQTIRARLDEIRNKAFTDDQHPFGDTVAKDQFALALVDTRERVDKEFYRLFPEYDPEVQRKKQEEREFKRACEWASLSPEEQQKVLRDEAREYAKWQRRATSARRSYRALREDPAQRYDGAAWMRGKQAAESVNLRADAEVNHEERQSIKTKKEIR